MEQVLTAGQNAALGSDQVTLTVAGPLDVSVLVCSSDRRVSGDDDMYFYNRPSGPGVTVDGASVALSLTALRAGADVLVLAASPADQLSTFGQLPSVSVTITAGTQQWLFRPDRLTVETCLILCEVYRYQDVWKVRALGQGYANGLAGVATDFGINVDPPGRDSVRPESSAPAWAAPAPAPSAPMSPAPATAGPGRRAGQLDAAATTRATELAHALAAACQRANGLYEQVCEAADQWSRAHYMANADYVDGVQQHPISKQHFAKLAQQKALEVEPLLHRLRGERDQGLAIRSDFYLLVGGPTSDTGTVIDWMNETGLPSDVQTAVIVQGILISVDFGVTLDSFLAANERMNQVINAQM